MRTIFSILPVALFFQTVSFVATAGTLTSVSTSDLITELETRIDAGYVVNLSCTNKNTLNIRVTNANNGRSNYKAVQTHSQCEKVKSQLFTRYEYSNHFVSDMIQICNGIRSNTYTLSIENGIVHSYESKHASSEECLREAKKFNSRNQY